MIRLSVPGSRIYSRIETMHMAMYLAQDRQLKARPQLFNSGPEMNFPCRFGIIQLYIDYTFRDSCMAFVSLGMITRKCSAQR